MFFSSLHAWPSLRRSLTWAGLIVLGLSGVTAGRATTVVPPEFSALVNESDYIVHAVVKSVRAEKRTASTGMKIVTLVELNVLEVVAGTAPAAVTLEFLGGQVGDEELIVHGMPRFRVGDEDILFVSGNGRSICPLYAMMHGRYPVLTDAATGQKYVARSDLAPLRNTADISRPLADGATAALQRQSLGPAAALTPAAFIGSIRAGLNPIRTKNVP